MKTTHRAISSKLCHPRTQLGTSLDVRGSVHQLKFRKSQSGDLQRCGEIQSLQGGQHVTQLIVAIVPPFLCKMCKSTTNGKSASRELSSVERASELRRIRPHADCTLQTSVLRGGADVNTSYARHWPVPGWEIEIVPSTSATTRRLRERNTQSTQSQRLP